ncbi:MAG: N-acetylmuramoyl-L-alanine amidase [Alphaproteobacteria bacterium]|nr:N-acetylmuramoyl-L-alanine amidase [Alphaproteobacteria bacterium]
MVYTRYPSFLAVLIGLIALAVPHFPALALGIDQIRLGQHSDRTRLVLDLDTTAQFRAFTLANPYRLVLDLPEFEWRAGSIEGLRTSQISAVRQGHIQPGLSRIVFDLKGPVFIQSAFSLPEQNGKPPRLVVDLKPSSPDDFRQNLQKMQGDLGEGVTPPLAPNMTTASSAPPVPARAPYRTASLDNMAPPSAPTMPKASPALKKPLVVIDPGHGGVDPGASGPGNIHEKTIVLALGKELAAQLESSGEYRVLMTRDRDEFVKLRDRVTFARTHGADLFVSIHADSIHKNEVTGASVYTLSEKASDEQTEKLAARENQADLIAGIDLSVEDQDVANILVDLAMRDTMNQSKFFANNLVGTFKAGGLKTLPTPHRYAGFAVLKAPDIPSVLVEVGFMSSQKEAKLLNTPGYRKKIARSLKEGIDGYFNQVRKNDRI